METGTESDEAEGFFNRKTVAGGLVTVAAIGMPTIAELTWPQLDISVGLPLFALCGLGGLTGLVLLWLGHRQRTAGPSRRWKVVGMGQGWIEARVRNDAGDQIVASWNAGAGSDAISLWTTFRKRARPRRSAIVELTFDIDGTLFEWDVPDAAAAEFALNATTWRDVEAMKSMLAVMREGSSLRVSVPALGLRARFTLDGAFDTLEEAASLGEEIPAPPG